MQVEISRSGSISSLSSLCFFFALACPGAENGNLVLREGKPGDPIQKEPLWESGRPYAKKVQKSADAFTLLLLIA